MKTIYELRWYKIAHWLVSKKNVGCDITSSTVDKKLLKIADDV